MTDARFPPAFASILRSHLRLLDVGADLEPETDLAGSGLDSFGMVSLIVELEEEFGVMLPDEALSWATFRTPLALWGAIADLVEHP